MSHDVAELPTEPIDLRAARLREGLTLEQAAARYSITASGLSMIERGLISPRPGLAKLIADKYGFDVVTQWPPKDRAA